MPSTSMFKVCYTRLLELGCPVSQARRLVREIADHHEDLKLAALEEGLSETEAELQADNRIGEPVVLAEELAASLRRASWWGRHPFVGFCLLPPLGIITAFAAGLGVFWMFFSLYLTPAQQ